MENNTLDNYGDACIANIRDAWAKERLDAPKPVWVMLESCAPCDVVISEESLRACTEALLK